MINRLIAILIGFCLMGCGQEDRDPFAGLRQGSVFHLTSDEYCSVLDSAGVNRMQVPCGELRDFLFVDSNMCQTALTRNFVPWLAKFPGSERELRLCRSYTRPERPKKDRIRFLVFGDAGRGNDLAQGYAQSRVAASMRRLCSNQACDFALVVGDLIYPAGVSDVFDPAFDRRFEDEYRDFGDFDFYLVPGNHDYHGNVQAQVEYTYFSDRWRMLDRHFLVPDLPSWLSIYAADSTAMVESDVASTRSAQESELQNLLCDHSGWRMIFGHHPPVSHGEHGDSLPMAEILESWSDRCSFQLYFAGHDHHQEFLSTSLFDIVLQGAGGAAVRDVEINASPRTWGTRGGIVEQLFARSEHGFALVEVTAKTVVVSYYSIRAWDFAAAQPLGLVEEDDAIFRCTWKFGETGGCRPSL